MNESVVEMARIAVEADKVMNNNPIISKSCRLNLLMGNVLA